MCLILHNLGCDGSPTRKWVKKEIGYKCFTFHCFYTDRKYFDDEKKIYVEIFVLNINTSLYSLSSNKELQNLGDPVDADVFWPPQDRFLGVLDP